MSVSVSVLNQGTELADLIQAKGYNGTACDALSEFAGRVCYASEARMGDASGFIANRLAEGHADVVEHGWVSVLMPYVPKINSSRYIAVRVENGMYRASGNLRAWYDSNAAEIEPSGQIATALRGASPSVFAAENGCIFALPVYRKVQSGKHAQALGWCYASPGADDHNQATFLLNGVSRSLTHQLVRHRLGSFSQRSQRYVDQGKAGWEYVTPPSIRDNPDARSIYDSCMATVEGAYRELRAMSIRKEDARFVLPNADTTKIVVSMTFAGWRHFAWLRALDRAAQWEIRAVAQEVLTILHEIAPSEWAVEMDRLTTDERLRAGLD